MNMPARTKSSAIIALISGDVERDNQRLLGLDLRTTRKGESTSTIYLNIITKCEAEIPDDIHETYLSLPSSYKMRARSAFSTQLSDVNV